MDSAFLVKFKAHAGTPNSTPITSRTGLGEVDIIPIARDKSNCAITKVGYPFA